MNVKRIKTASLFSLSALFCLAQFVYVMNQIRIKTASLFNLSAHSAKSCLLASSDAEFYDISRYRCMYIHVTFAVLLMMLLEFLFCSPLNPRNSNVPIQNSLITSKTLSCWIMSPELKVEGPKTSKSTMFQGLKTNTQTSIRLHTSFPYFHSSFYICISHTLY